MHLAIPSRRSQRIRDNNNKRFLILKNSLMLNIHSCKTVPLVEPNMTVSEKNIRRWMKREQVYTIYNNLCQNFNLLLVLNSRVSIERFLKMSMSRIAPLIADCVRNRLFDRNMKQVFKRFCYLYNTHHKNKVFAMVLVSLRFPKDITQIISKYFLMPSNFSVV